MITHQPNARGWSEWGNAWYRVDSRPDCVIVTAVGDVDHRTAVGLDHALQSELHHAPRLILDMSQVTFIDSAGLGALINARDLVLHVGGSLALVAPPTVARTLLTAKRLQASFTVFDKLDDALWAVQPQ